MHERSVTVIGLAVGALGIAVLWAGGVEFPVAIPPGIVILGAAALLVALVRRPWTAAVGAAAGLFVVIGFLVSPTGIDNLTGEDGAVVASGQAIQVAGVATAAVAGALAFRRERRTAAA